jgi:tetratricopeptide (TPR) repeat protein
MTAEEFKDEGDLALAIGELEEAVSCYRQSVEANGRYFDGWQALTMALVKIGQYDEAIEAGNRAVAIDPNNLFGWTSLSLAYNRANRIAEAEAAGTKAKIISWGGKIKTDETT